MDIKAPDLGVDSADVSEILVKVGEHIDKEQSLLVLESSKASVEVPSPLSGVIKSIAIRQGQTVKQGDVLFELEDDVNRKSGDSGKSDGNDNSDRENSGQDQDQDQDQDNASKHTQSAPKQTQDAESELSSDTPSGHTTQSRIKDVKVPDLGVDEADVSEILVKVGDQIDKEQSLIVLESAKASVEVPSPMNGIVKEIKLKTGQKVKQGMAILSIEASQTEPASPTASEHKALSSQSLTDSANTARHDSSEKTSYDSGQQAQNQPAAQSLTANQIKANSEVYAGPAVRQLARQLGVSLAQVTPSGANQRVIKEDVLAFVKQALSADSPSTVSQHDGLATGGLPPLPDFEKFGGSIIQPMTRLQQVSVPQLSLNNYIPQVTQFDLADITDLENWRNTLKADYKKQQISLTILAFIVKALAYLLQKETHFNSHLADDQKSIVVRNEIHIGIAVATDEGLTVPVLRNPDVLSIKEIAIQLGELSQKARDKKLKPQELQGASFTVTSLGSIGGTAFTPLVNWPQVAILGISPATMQSVWNGKDFEPRLMLPLSLSYDHRVINGADAARFSHALTEILADIRRVLL